MMVKEVKFYFDSILPRTVSMYFEPRINYFFGKVFRNSIDTYFCARVDETCLAGCLDRFIDSVNSMQFVIEVASPCDGYVVCRISYNHDSAKSSAKSRKDGYKKYYWRQQFEEYNVDIYQDKERATGKFKTTVKWSDGEVVTLRADKNTLPIYYIFAYAYCEKKFGSNSTFKRYVDKHCVKMDKELIFEDDGVMTSMRIYQYGNGHPAIDLYSRVALLIAAKAYGGVEKLKKVASDALH